MKILIKLDHSNLPKIILKLKRFQAPVAREVSDIPLHLHVLTGGVGGSVIVDARLTPPFCQGAGYWQLPGKTGSSRNQSGHPVSRGDGRAQRPSVHQGSVPGIPGRQGLPGPPPASLDAAHK